MSFDPWSATWEQALSADGAWLGDEAAPDRPLAQWVAAQHVAGLRERVERGDGNAAMDAVASCVRRGLAAPDWLARKFLRCYDSVLNCRAHSWDEAYGAPFPPRTKLETMRLRRLKQFELQSFFRRSDAPPRTPEGWQAAAEALGISPKQAKEWTPKTRRNIRGHKPYRPESDAAAAAHDPFGLGRKKAP